VARVEVDGQLIKTLAFNDPGAHGQTSLDFVHRFDTAGPHVVSLKLDSLNQPDQQQHAIVEVVPAIPVLVVDGDDRLTPEGSSFFVRRALEGTPDQPAGTPVALRVRARRDFRLADLEGDRPRAVILADVAGLTAEQRAALDGFIEHGGSVLLAVGPRMLADGAVANEMLYRDGKGWLPARLLGAARDSAQPEVRTFAHPALEMFRRDPGGALAQVRFKRWARIATDSKHGGAVVALLSNGDPLLVEKKYGRGRVMLCTVTLDRSDGSSLPAAWEFPVLLHELVYYLAGAAAGDHVLADGQPWLVQRPDASASTLLLQTPEETRTVAVADWPWTYANTGAVGIYSVRVGDGPAQYRIVRPDSGETDGRRCSDADWRKVLALLPGLTASDDEAGGIGDHRRHELWWLLLLGVIGLLCVEVIVTRRAVLARRR
jgi:hypothetical protein